MHIPKNAGTSFNRILANEYGNKNVQFRKVIALDQKLILTIDEIENFNVFVGHYSYGRHKNFSSNFRYITFVREPVSRIISHYKYVSRTPVHNLYKVIKSENLSLKEYALSNLSLELDNGMIRQITGSQLPINKLNHNLLKEAKDNIQRHFEVGITEMFDESIILFKDSLKWEKSNFYYKMRVSSKKSQTRIDNETIRLIGERNYLDTELYNWCVSVFKKRVNEIPNFSEKLEKYKFLNKLYSSLYAKPLLLIKTMTRELFMHNRLL